MPKYVWVVLKINRVRGVDVLYICDHKETAMNLLNIMTKEQQWIKHRDSLRYNLLKTGVDEVFCGWYRRETETAEFGIGRMRLYTSGDYDKAAV